MVSDFVCFLQEHRSVVIALIFGAVLSAAIVFLSVLLVAAEPRQIAFYVDEPACVDRKVGYVTLAGRNRTTEELHRVWICGLGVR